MLGGQMSTPRNLHWHWRWCYLQLHTRIHRNPLWKMWVKQPFSIVLYVYVKDNHQPANCVWTEKELIRRIYIRISYLVKGKKDAYRRSDSLCWIHALTITISNAPILKRNTTLQFKALILKDYERLGVIFSELTAHQMQSKSSPSFSATLFEHKKLTFFR